MEFECLIMLLEGGMNEWIFQVLVKGGRYYTITRIGSVYRLYTRYILPSRGLYNPYHLSPEPQ